MVALCNQQGDHVGKILDVLTQLLQTSDEAELQQVQQSLIRMLRKPDYTKGMSSIDFDCSKVAIVQRH